VTFEVIGAVVFGAIGTGILTWTAINFVYALLSRSWPKAIGAVIASDLRRSRDSEGGYLYRAEVSYRYSVDGQEFVATRSRFGDRLEVSWSAAAANLVRRYPVGTAVHVHYDPTDPSEAVLEPGINGLLFAGAGTGALFVFLALGSALWFGR
jgi:hypothetical protein